MYYVYQWRKCGNKYPQIFLYMFTKPFKKMLSLDSFLCFIEPLESKVNMCIAATNKNLNSFFDYGNISCRGRTVKRRFVTSTVAHFFTGGVYDGYPPTKSVLQLQKLMGWMGMSTEPPSHKMTDTIPEYFLTRGINHFSPSQASLALDQWVFKYLYYNQEDRRKLKTTAKMHAGNAAGIAAQNILERSNQEQVLNNFVTTDQKEQEQHEQNQQAFAETLVNITKAFKEIGVVDDVDKQYENYVSGEFTGLVLPVIGRTDVESKRFLIELKTKWRTRGGLKKDGTRSYTKSKVPDKPAENHLKQLAFYHTFKPKVKSLLVYVGEREDHGYKIFDIEDYNPKLLMEEFRDDLEVKQNIAQLDDPRKYVKKDFSHWGWDIGEENLKEAKRYYGYQ